MAINQKDLPIARQPKITYRSTYVPPSEEDRASVARHFENAREASEHALLMARGYQEMAKEDRQIAEADLAASVEVLPPY